MDGQYGVTGDAWLASTRVAEFRADPGRHHATEDELGMPWMIALVGVPLMALKM